MHSRSYLASEGTLYWPSHSSQYLAGSDDVIVRIPFSVWSIRPDHPVKLVEILALNGDLESVFPWVDEYTIYSPTVRAWINVNISNPGNKRGILKVVKNIPFTRRLYGKFGMVDVHDCGKEWTQRRTCRSARRFMESFTNIQKQWDYGDWSKDEEREHSFTKNH